jgi:hypothetical protein
MGEYEEGRTGNAAKYDENMHGRAYFQKSLNGDALNWL